MKTYLASELEMVFGTESMGNTPEKRAHSSATHFVRGQFQLAVYSEGATGRVLSAREALRTFGWQVLRQATLEGSAPLVISPKEPATTLKLRREELGLSVEQLAKKVHLLQKDIQQAETVGAKSAIRTLESLAQALALNEQALGFLPNAGRDTRLGVRLREMATSGDIAGFSASTVLQLSEAAWVISRQAALQNQLEVALGAPRVAMPRHDSNFSYPAYETGYRLASRTRELLGLDAESPVESVRKIIEEDFGLPLIQLQMDTRFAGATLANGSVRGIVVNESGMNSNVWVRRMTLCHELGHLLWDPSDRLQQVTVDAYADLDMSDRETRRDQSEIRANAFAIAFLAPPTAVKRIADVCSTPLHVVSEVMKTFGISATAAKHHVRNVTKLDTFDSWTDQFPDPKNQWVAMENLTLDYFPIQKTPLSRRGKFAWYVAKAFEIGEITLDSASSWLSVPGSDVTDSFLRRIADLWEEAPGNSAAV